MNHHVTNLYEELGVRLSTTSGTDASTRCFAAPADHQREDRHPSTSVNLGTGAWICHACGARGGAYDAALLRGHTPRTAMDLLIRHGLAERRHQTGRQRQQTGPQHPPHRETSQPRRAPAVTKSQIETWHDRLRAHPTITRRLHIERSIAPQTTDHFLIGFDGSRITIPIPIIGDNHTLEGVLRWKPFDRRRAPKMLALPGTRRQLFPAPETLNDRELIICEGEPDALAAHSAGLAAVAIPGVASWRPQWAQRFAGRHVTIVLDCDRQGRRCAARIAADLTAASVNAVVLDLAPERADGYDLTDHLVGN